jgi:preprotein translocase subunit SecA
VLNAKQHESEAKIVAMAGHKGAVTVATNMAGRGTDIMLGGSVEFLADQELRDRGLDPLEDSEAYEAAWPETLERIKRQVAAEHDEVKAAGGLYVLGTERHESRRIDNQLRGRAGRQGDPGSSRFFLSLEDDLMRIFAGDKVKALMQRLGMEKGVAIESGMVSKRIAAAQKSVEGRNFEARKHLLEYDDVMNKQRETIYGLRRQLMEEPDQREYLMGDPPSSGVAYDLLSDITRQYLNPDVSPDDWDVENYKLQVKTIYDLDIDREGIDVSRMTSPEVADAIWDRLKVKYESKENQIGPEAMRTYERIIMLNIIDAQWKDHLLSLDHLKQGIGLVGYGQKDPLVEYKKQSFDLFQEMLDRIDTTTIRSLFNLQVVSEQAPENLQQRRAARRPASLKFTGPNQGAAPAGEEDGKVKTVVRDQPKVGRNEPCPCGSGKKYKKCHGINA